MSAGFAGLDEVWVKLLASFGITDYDEATGRRMRAAYNTAVARLRDNWNKERYKRLPDWDQRMNVFSRLVPDNLAFKKLMRAGTEHESTAAIINPSTLMVDFLSFDGELDEFCRVCEPKYFTRMWNIVSSDLDTDSAARMVPKFKPSIQLSYVLSTDKEAMMLLSAVPETSIPFNSESLTVVLPEVVEGRVVVYSGTDGTFNIEGVSDESAKIRPESTELDLLQMDPSSLSFYLLYYAGLVAIDAEAGDGNTGKIVFAGSLTINAWLSYREAAMKAANEMIGG